MRERETREMLKYKTKERTRPMMIKTIKERRYQHKTVIIA